MNDKRNIFKQWQEKAKQDLATINILKKSRTAPRSVIAFHCQQAIEKYFKAFLAYN